MKPTIRATSFASAAFACAFAFGATLDFVPDAVLGKPDFVTATPGAPSASNIQFATAIAIDPVSDELWVVDRNANRVLRFASASAFSNGQAANLVVGQADFSSGSPNRGGSTARNSLSNPSAVAVDQTGRLYVADTSNHRVLVFRPPFTNGMDASDMIGQADFISGASNRGGLPGAGSLSSPSGLALDRVNQLYVADTANHRVLRYDTPVHTGDIAIDVWGQPNLTTAVPGTSATALSSPMGLGGRSGFGFWVADAGNHRVLSFDTFNAANHDAGRVLCQSDFASNAAGTSASTCRTPIGVAVDSRGNVVVSDANNNRLLFFPSQANGENATSVIGQEDFSANACNRGLVAPDAGSLCFPAGAASDPLGNLLIADGANGRLLRLDRPVSRRSPFIGEPSPGGVAPRTGAFVLTLTGYDFYRDTVVTWNGSPRPTVYLGSGRLLVQVADGDVGTDASYEVAAYTPEFPQFPATRAVVTYARAPLDGLADRVLGSSGFFPESGDLDNPVGEEVLGPVNAAKFARAPGSLVIDRTTGRLFVAELSSSRVLSWPNASTFRNAEPAEIVIGQADEFDHSCNAGGIGAATLCQPVDVALDPAGRLYVADRGNHRVLRYSPPYATGMNADRVYGQAGSFTSAVENNGGVGAASLKSPVAVCATASRLFVIDDGNNRILIYDDPANDAVADVVLGHADFTTSTAEGLSFSSGGLALDTDGRLYASLLNQHRVLRFVPPFVNGMAPDIALGQPSLVSTDSGFSMSSLFWPIGIAVDLAGALLVADDGNRRVLRYEPPFSTGMAATGRVAPVEGFGRDALENPIGVATDRFGNVFVTDVPPRLLAYDRPFALPIDPAADFDNDGIPDVIEPGEFRDPYAKDNDVFANNRLFAMQQYRDFLAREGDAGGIQYYVNQLFSGASTPDSVIVSFFDSPEFQGAGSPITRLYFATFQRTPDYDGLVFQVNAARAGTPLTVIANNFTLSPEFSATYGSLDNSQFVSLLYTNILGRTASQGEIDYYVARLTGRATRGEVLLGFSESPEYQTAINTRVFVTLMYVGMLRRSPEAQGLAFWSDYIDAGNPRLSLILGFLNAPEYHGRFLP